jgi:hypothetical protein
MDDKGGEIVIKSFRITSFVLAFVLEICTTAIVCLCLESFIVVSF